MIKNLIKNGRQTLPMNDIGKFPKAQCKFFTEIKNVKNLTPFKIKLNTIQKRLKNSVRKIIDAIITPYT